MKKTPFFYWLGTYLCTSLYILDKKQKEEKKGEIMYKIRKNYTNLASTCVVIQDKDNITGYFISSLFFILANLLARAFLS